MWKASILILNCLSILTQGSPWIEPEISTYKVVLPFRTTSNGQILSHDVRFSPNESKSNARFKRKIESDPTSTPAQDSEEKFYVVINNDKEELLLELTPNKKLVTPYTVIEWVLESGEKVIKRFSDNCFYYGRDVKADGPSLVAVSNCDGLTGYIQTNNESYFIEPLTLELKRKLLKELPESQEQFQDDERLQNEINSAPRPHIIYKVKTILNKLNLSIQTDQDYDGFDHTTTVLRSHPKERFSGNDPTSLGNTPQYFSEGSPLPTVTDSSNRYRRWLKKGERRVYYPQLGKALSRLRRSAKGRKDYRHLKGGKRSMAFLYKRNTSKEEKERKRKRGNRKRNKDRCKKVKNVGNPEESEEERERLCKTKRERKARRKELKEKRARERERRREERRRRKERKRKLKEQKKLKDLQSDSSSSENLHSSVFDPLHKEDWQGYSPDLLWDTPVAAGRSGLSELVLGAPLNNTDPQKWLELTVGVDHTVIQFHGEENVEKYVLTLFNIVSAIYEDPSLEANLQIVLLRLIFYKDKKQSQVKKGLAKRSLESVNRWAERLYKLSPEHLKHDLAVWLTRYDLGGPSGYAPVNGVCEPERSCTLNRDEGLTSAFIIAHEMGHVLGMSHDGDVATGNVCESEGMLGSVMAPLVAATFGRFHWSRCSKSEYHNLASQMQWECLSNQPEWKNATVMSSSIQYQYTFEDQCRMEFGEGYGLCENFGFSDPCSFLWCSNATAPHFCKTKKGPPLEGTLCGQDKWCRHGYCESISDHSFEVSHNETSPQPTNPPVRHNPQHGGWSPWSDWGSCSRTCGTGVSFRIRACDSPEPRWGGRTCQGKREEWRVCSTDPCSDPGDLRAQQCGLLQYLVKLGKRRSSLTWLPYEPRKRRKKCRLTCYSMNTNEIYLGREFLLDGTPCSYSNPDDICVQGKCIPMGCDKKIGSSVRTDTCGVCDGRDRTCGRRSFIYKGLPQRDYTPVAVLPKDAWKISVQEESKTYSFLSIRNNKSQIVFNSNKVQGPSLDIVVEGALFHYMQKGEHDYLMASGPLLKDITIMVHGGDVLEPVTITTTYIMQENPEIYKWEIGPLSGCSATCGGGVRFETLICRDKRNNEEVSHVQCDHLPMPRVDAVPCNQFGCSFRWVSGQWESCSATCGNEGVQQRVVSCIKVNGTEQNWSDRQETKPEDIVDPIQCATQPEPENKRECNRKSCPAYWKPLGWTKCSVKCGMGEQERIFYCDADVLNEVIDQCGEKPREMRACYMGDCPPSLEGSECPKDKSHFCQLPSLHRYCKIPKYRQLCCHTCANEIPFT